MEAGRRKCPDLDGYCPAGSNYAPLVPGRLLDTRTGGATNLVITQIGTDGKVCLYTSDSTHLIADINGYIPGPAHQ